MTKIKLELPDSTVKQYENQTTPYDVALSIGEGLARSSVGAVIKTDTDESLIDLSTPINTNCKIRIITKKDEEYLKIIRHSCAHLLAHAVQELFPYAKPTIGPTTDNGFFYDFDHEPFKEEDLKKIEKKMTEISNRNLEITRKQISKDEALKIFKDNKYKVELIEELDDKNITIYEQGNWVDLCSGPHVSNTKFLKAFKLERVTGSYWRGDAKNTQLQRIYGFAFNDSKELNKFLAEFEEAKKRDHKKIGKEMNLFMISELIGKGLPVWLPKGNIIKEEIEKLANEMEDKAGFTRVSTPHLAKEELFLKSGHLPHYEESMYPKMEMDDGSYYLKAMNCPLHHLIFGHKPKSYKELPLRLAEYGTVYRNELSGALSGLLRVRMLSMNDAHIYCTKSQIAKEIKSVIEMIENYYKLFGFENYYFRLSTWDAKRKDKYIDEPKNWKYTQNVLKKILDQLKVNYKEVEDEAAFYGPKIDIQFKTVLGREETMSTVQLDFAAKKKFNLEYTDQNGELNNEVFVIHRSPLSTHERFGAFVIEKYGGKFPLWLNPNQIKVISVSEKFFKYAKKINKKLQSKTFRSELDENNDSISKKIRNAQVERFNYMIIIGEKEVESNTVTVRSRNGENREKIDLKQFLKEITEERKLRK